MNTTQILSELKSLETHILRTTSQWQHWLENIDPRYRLSARNLLRYAALRQKDLRRLQIELGNFGLTLSQCERHVLRNLREVIARIQPANVTDTSESDTETISWKEAKHLLHQHSREVFGTPPSQTPASVPHQAIMVTASLPMTAELCEDIIQAGATVLRINTAHDDPQKWEDVCRLWRAAASRQGISTRILVDIAGPKLRTGRVRMPEPFLKFKPVRSYDGTVIESFRVNLIEGPECTVAPDVWTIPGLETIEAPTSISFTDSRGRHRKFPVNRDNTGRLWFDGDRTCYLKSGCPLMLTGTSGSGVTCNVQVTRVTEEVIFLRTGDRIRLCSPAAYPRSNTDLPSVESLEPGLLTVLKTGQIVAFDDGRIVCRVISADSTAAVLEVEQTIKPLVRLARDKGINTPGTILPLPLLNRDDVDALRFATRNADIVSFSFIRSREDIPVIWHALDGLGATQELPVMLKIETASAFADLPAILLTAMRRYPVALMIARGDLAVEVGYMRSGEVQEEILSIAEAAHIPVVLATEVLGQMLKTGSPSRAEVTDAAMSVRAECVMLNKGPFIVEAIRSLRDVLLKMQMHRYKNLEIFRPTSWSRAL